jgi:hypothetical protein
MALDKRATRRFLIASAVLGSGFVIAGCGGSSNNNSSAQGSAGGGTSHKTISLARAADISSDAAGYKVHMVMAETVAAQTINMSVDGSFTPKSHQGALTMDMALPASLGGEQKFQVVMANDTFYMKMPPALASKIPGAKPWFAINLKQLGKAAKMPGLASLLNSSQSLNNPGEYLDFLRAATAGSVTTVGQETIDGVQTTHYEATIQFSKLADALPQADRQAMQQLISELEQKASVQDMPIDVWIDGSDLVRRIMMNIKETVQGHPITVAITEDLSDYGTQPAPTIPSASQTTNLLSLMHSGG